MTGYKFVVHGSPIVKKSTQRVINRGRRSFVVYSSAYQAWQKQAILELSTQKRPSEPLDYPLLLVCKFFMQTRRIVDLSALYEGIQEVLVKMDVLADDNSRIVIGHDGSRVYLDRENPRTEVVIIPQQG